MRKRFLCPLFLLAALFLTVSASAAGETPPGRVEIANRAYSDAKFSCDAQLSGTNIQGRLFAVVFAESKRVKSVSEYPAAETVKVELSNVADTDYINLLWTDANDMPLASRVTLRMEANGKTAYEDFAQKLAELADLAPVGGDGASASNDPYALRRLLMSCDSLPDLSAYKGKMQMVPGPDNFYVLQFYDPETAKDCEKYLRACPSVRYVEPDVILQAEEKKPETLAILQGMPDSPPWGAEKTHLREYAEYLSAKKGGGSSVIVAVVDSGVDADHPFLKGRLVEGRNFVEHEKSIYDKHGHGTHVAGTIVSCAPDVNVKIMPVRVLNAFNCGSLLGIYNGICYAREHGANVINLSLKLNASYPPIEEAINSAISKNITVVVAAGNDNGNAKNCSPANIEKCVTVAAVDKNLKRGNFSNFGETVDIAAPGVNVESCWPGGAYVESDGTSMAAPHVSAAAALLICERGFVLTPDQISDALKKAAKGLTEDSEDDQWEFYRKLGHSWSNFLGAGFLDMSPFIPHTVTLDANDGSGRTLAVAVSAGKPFAWPDNPFDRTGYRLTNWNTQADGSGISYQNGAPLNVTEDRTLYAQWKPVERTVTFDANGGMFSDGSTVKKIPIKEGETVAPPTDVTRSDYNFIGWRSNKDATTPFDFSQPINADTTIYAAWDTPPVSQTITLRFGDAQWTDSDEDLQGYADLAGRTVLAVPIVATSSDGKAFDMGGCEFQVNFNPTALVYKDIADEGCGVLGFVGNGKDFLSVSATTEANANANGFVKTLFSDTKARNFTVENNQVIAKIVFWPNDAGKEIASRLSFQDGARVSAVNADKNPLPYAVSVSDAIEIPPYPVESVKVTFDANGGATTQTVVINKGETVTPPTNPTRDGYKFSGWRSNKDATTPFDFSQPINADTTIYAAWDTPPVSQTITLRFGDAQWTDSDEDLQGYADLAGRTVLAVPIVAESSDGKAFDMGGCEFQVNFNPEALVYKDIEDEGSGALGFVGNGKDFLSVSATTAANANANGFVKTLFSDTKARNFTVENNQVIAKIVFWPNETGKEIASRLSFQDGARVSAVNADKNPVPYAVSVGDAVELPPYPVESVKVTFDANGGATTQTVVINKGETVTPPTNPTRDGYKFSGWRSNKDATTPFDFSQPINADTIIYAAWDMPPTRQAITLRFGDAQWTDSDEDLQGYADLAGRTVLAVPIVATSSDGKAFDMGGCEFQVNFNPTALVYKDIADEGCGVLGFVVKGKNSLNVSATTAANANANGFVKVLFSDTAARNFTVENNQVIAKIVFWPNETGKEIAPRLSFQDGARVSVVDADKNPTPYAVSVSDAVEIPPYPVKEASPYALLYGDGEMIFQNGNAANPEKTLLGSYAIPTDGGEGQYVGWHALREQIQTVTFAEAIQPVSTALWFYDCENLTEIRGLENLDLRKTTNMSQMFARCTSLTALDFGGLDTSSVTNMSRMFFMCGALKDIYASNAFDVSNVTESADMFTGCTSLANYDPNHTDKEYARMDGGASAPGYFTDKNAPIPSADIYAVLYADGELVFQNNDRTESGRSVAKTYEVDLNEVYVENRAIYLSRIPWNTERESVRVVNFADKVSPTATTAWFYECENLELIDNIQNLDTANVTNMSWTFRGCSGLTALDVSNFNTANVKRMDCMFEGCSGLTALDVSRFDTSNVTGMKGMFSDCSGLTALEVSRFDTSNVTSMNGMFSGCSGLTALDVSHFNTANVTNMSSMFSHCSGLITLDLSRFNTANVTDMGSMFSRCSGLTALDLSNFNTANVMDMNRMFEGCSGLTALDVSRFDTSNIVDMYYMFSGCSKLKTIYVSDKFTTTSMMGGANMFDGCTSLIGGAGTKYDGAHTDKEYARIDGGASAPGYFTAKNADSNDLPVLRDS